MLRYGAPLDRGWINWNGMDWPDGMGRGIRAVGLDRSGKGVHDTPLFFFFLESCCLRSFGFDFQLASKSNQSVQYSFTISKSISQSVQSNANE